MTESSVRGAGESSAACSVCRRVRAGTAVYSDASWVALPSPERPGWLTLATRRHSDWSWGLDKDEAGSFGHAYRLVSEAAQGAIPAERLYILGFGEQTNHFHVLLVPGLETLHADFKAALKAAGPLVSDREAATQTADRISAKVRSLEDR